jgi:uncharacterized protein involved in exopolysaccharide biosynthesis
MTTVTPRDRLQRLVDLGRKTLRYWWLIAIFAIVGGALSFAFAMFKTRSYQSYASVFYQEQIQAGVLSPNREEIVQRNLGDKYRELLLAREQIEPILDDPALTPFPADLDRDIAVERLREQIKLEVRGNAFHIIYTDSEPERAKNVTARLTELLQKKDEGLRNEQARATVDFVMKKKEDAAVELRKREQSLNEFLAQHPEFVADPNQNSAEGAIIRAQKQKTAAAMAGNPDLAILEARRQRISARLDTPADAPPVRIPAPPSPERVSAEAEVADAQREVGAAKRELEDAQSKYQDIHPTVIKAKERFANAQQRLRHAQAAVPPETETIIAPASAADREKLRRDLARVESDIAALRNSKGKPAVDTQYIVDLENKHVELRRLVTEQREKVGALADSAFRAQIDADLKVAEQGGRLKVIGAAFKPTRPTGPGRSIFLMAGMVLFVGLGLAFAVGLAVIDDRLYQRHDLDPLQLPVLAVIPRVNVHSAGRRARAAKRKASSA